MDRTDPPGRSKYTSLVGKPGVVYVLENDGLRQGWLKIGCSARSGHARAVDLNSDANTGTPGVFQCVFQVRTQDCGTAEQEVFARLQANRRGKWGQEFFEVDLSVAKETITLVCAEVDRRGSAAAAPAPEVVLARSGPRPLDLKNPAALRPSRQPIGGRSQWRKPGMTPFRRWVYGSALLLLLLGIFGQGADDTHRKSSVASTSAPSPAAKVAKPAVNPVVSAAGGREGAAKESAARPATGTSIQPMPEAGDSSGTDNSVGHTPVTPVGSTGPVDVAAKPTVGSAPDAGRAARVTPVTSCTSERMMQDPEAYRRCLNGQQP